MLTQLYTRARVLLIVALFTVIVMTALWGHAVSGTISGTVTDPSGAAIAGATVEVKNTAMQVVRTGTTNAQDRYVAPGLFVGNPSVQIGSDRALGRDVFRVA